MTRAKSTIELRVQCRCGKWLKRPSDERCVWCLVARESANADVVKARLRAKLDPGPCDDYGRST